MSRRSRGRSLWAIGGTAVVAVVILTVAASVMAVLGGDLSCLGGAGIALAQPPTRAAARDIPPARLKLFQAAGRRWDIDWTFVASIAEQECGSGNCPGDSGSGCAGPMQIADVPDSPCSPGPGPTLWDRFGYDADGDGEANVNDPGDAIPAAAHIMRVVMHAPPAGGSYAGYRQAACNYYGACGDSVADYANEVMARAVEYGFHGKGSPAPSTPAATQPAATEEQGPSCAATTTGGASGNEIVRIAESQIGTSENPPGSNCNPYGPCEEWCALFVAWVWEKAGVPLHGGTAPYAYSGSIYEWAKAHEAGPSLPGGPAPGESPFSRAMPNGARVLPPTATPARGDAVLFGTGPQSSDHIGIVERVFGDGEITTIDGNYGDSVARVGPFLPSQALASGEPAPIYGYAQPLGAGEQSGGVR